MLPLKEHIHIYTFLVHNNFSKYKNLALLFNDNLFECFDFHQYDIAICATLKSKTTELYLTGTLVYQQVDTNTSKFFLVWEINNS